jgi:hypothetical protein
MTWTINKQDYNNVIYKHIIKQLIIYKNISSLRAYD